MSKLNHVLIPNSPTTPEDIIFFIGPMRYRREGFQFFVSESVGETVHALCRENGLDVDLAIISTGRI